MSDAKSAASVQDCRHVNHSRKPAHPPLSANVSLGGHVYRITDPTAFFLPLLMGASAPADAYQPWAGVHVTPWAVADGPVVLPLTCGGAVMTGSDGGFRISRIGDETAWLVSAFGGPSRVRLFLEASLASPPGGPLYRSDLDTTVAEAEDRELNIWLLPESLPGEGRITAGHVSDLVAGASLPLDTTITASPSGLSFCGSDAGVKLEFGFSLTPDTGRDLDSHLALTLVSWNLGADVCASARRSATSILARTRSGLQAAGSAMNAAVLSRMTTTFEQRDGPSPSDTSAFFRSAVSVTFMAVRYPTQHSWPLVLFNGPFPTDFNTRDATVVVTADRCLGYPRHLASSPAKPSIAQPLNLSTSQPARAQTPKRG